jgi:hypothetical protein
LESGVYLADGHYLNGAPRHLNLFFVYILFMAYGVFVRFSTRGARAVQKHHKHFLGEVHVKKLLAEKVEKKPFFPVVFFH